MDQSDPGATSFTRWLWAWLASGVAKNKDVLPPGPGSEPGVCERRYAEYAQDAKPEPKGLKLSWTWRW